ERELVLRLELFVGGDIVRADAEYFRVPVAKHVVGIAELAGLGGAAGRVVLRIEVENDRSATQVRELDRFAGVALELEVGGGLAFLDHGGSSLEGALAMLTVHHPLAF